MKKKFHKGSFAKPSIKKIANTVKKLKRFVPMLKQVSAELGEATIGAPIVAVGPIPDKGDEQYNRSGTKIKMHSVETRLTLRGAESGNACRVLHLLWKRVGASGAPSIGSLIAGYDYSGAALTTLINAPINYNNKKNIKVLSDRVYNLPAYNNQATSYPPVKTVHHRFNLKGIDYDFSVAGGHLSTDVTQNLFITCIIPLQTVNQARYNLTSTLNFTDG